MSAATRKHGRWMPTHHEEEPEMTRRRSRSHLAAIALPIFALLACSATASAKVGHEEVGSFATQTSFPMLAVDNSAGPNAGSVWVAEPSVNFAGFPVNVFGPGRAYRVDAGGTATGTELQASETPAGSFGFTSSPSFFSKIADGLAVDGSAGSNAGDVYVADLEHGVVDRFHEDGTYDCQITGAATPSASECAGATGSATPSGGVQPLSVAVSPVDGEVAVGDLSGVVYLFGEGGEYIGELAAAQITEPGSLAFDSSGALYVVNANGQFLISAEGSAVKFSRSGDLENTLTSSARGVGVDVGTDQAYVGSEEEVRQYDAAGAFISAFAAGAKVLSIGTRTTTGAVYVARPSEVQIWSTFFNPGVTTGPAVDVEEEGATLQGDVDPEVSEGGSPVVSCVFEYGLTEAYGESEACAEPPALPYEAPASVEARVGGSEALQPGTEYHYRLVAENEEGETGRGEDRAFSTFGPPGIGGERSIARTRSAVVEAQINPFGYDTTCEVEYVDEASYQDSGYDGAVSTPCDQSIPAGFGKVPVSATLSGLSIGTVYHYRFVAHNAARSEGGVRKGEDQAFSTFGIESFSVELFEGQEESGSRELIPYRDPAGGSYVPAGAHPYAMRVKFKLSETNPLTTRNQSSATANLHTVKVQLPPGLIGDPTATQRCPSYLVAPSEAHCPAETQVGNVKVYVARTGSPNPLEEGPVYNVAPPEGVAAQLGARLNSLGVVRIDAGVRSGSDYGIDADSLSVTALDAVTAVEVILWGVPADPGHDADRECRNGERCGLEGIPRPFLTTPTSCGGPLSAGLSVDSWQDPGDFVSKSAAMPPVEGCDRLPFDPGIEVRPDVRAAESPAGLHVDLHIPQNQNPLGLAEADLKDTSVRLPQGIAINPSGARGLDGCSVSDIGYKPGTSSPAEFTPDPAQCPDASKIGTVEVHTPLLDHPIKGGVYVARPYDNPFGSLLAIYIAVHDPQSGVVLKLAGKVTPDPRTGQLTTTFSENPQLPFEDFQLDFFGGPGASLMTPATCGEYTTTTDMRPWSENGDKHPAGSFVIDAGPNGSPCAGTPAALPNRQSFSAGTLNPVAGDETPFVLKLSRDDGTQRLSRIDTVLPRGLVGRLAGIPYCPEAALAAAAGKTGAAELAAPSCPAASRVASVQVGAGAGPQPYVVNGTAYLAGPYKGAPISLAVVTPAVAGPFDLGTVVVRVALYVDPETAQITAKSDPLPQILEGIPLDVRSIRLQTDITRNPTSCEVMSVDGTATSVLGEASPLSQRFQVGGCESLAFKPRLKLTLKGATKRLGHPALKAVVTARPGEANIARAQVNLPQGEFLDQGNLDKTCTRPVLLAGNCPKSSVYGKARAFTPLLEKPLEGPVYLVGGYGYKLPALVAELNGQIKVLLVGKVDSGKNKGIRSTFEAVPDAPVSRFVLEMKGGKKYGLLENSEDLCKASKEKRRAIASFVGQNGKAEHFKPRVAYQCKKEVRKKHQEEKKR